MTTKRQKEKLINAVIYFINNTHHCNLVKLLKLLAFFDFEHFRLTGQSATGLIYNAYPMGPVPEQLYTGIKSGNSDISDTIVINKVNTDDILDDKSKNVFKSKKKFNEKVFTKRELGILERLAEIYKEALAKDIITASHKKNDVWDKTVKDKGMYQTIDYELLLDMNETGTITREQYKEKNELKLAFESFFYS